MQVAGDWHHLGISSTLACLSCEWCVRGVILRDTRIAPRRPVLLHVYTASVSRASVFKQPHFMLLRLEGVRLSR